ncbi:hypothetical protein TNCV_4064311 [Trichonephila clavipes]|nr:hypothetical protein TNCV_4064311 [Trichonephila clavipes]
MLSAPDKTFAGEGNWKVGGWSTSRTTVLERSTCTLHCCQKWKRLRPKAASGTSSAREAARRLGLPPSSVRNILRRILSCTHTNCNRAMNFCQQIPHRGKHLRSGPSLKWNRGPTWVLTSLWTDEAHFSLHGDVNNHNFLNLGDL